MVCVNCQPMIRYRAYIERLWCFQTSAYIFSFSIITFLQFLKMSTPAEIETFQAALRTA